MNDKDKHISLPPTASISRNRTLSIGINDSDNISNSLKEEDNLEKLKSRLNFHETMTDLLMAEIPKYYDTLTSSHGIHSHLSQVMKQAGSFESRLDLQNIFFNFSKLESDLSKKNKNFVSYVNKSSSSSSVAQNNLTELERKLSKTNFNTQDDDEILLDDPSMLLLNQNEDLKKDKNLPIGLELKEKIKTWKDKMILPMKELITDSAKNGTAKYSSTEASLYTRMKHIDEITSPTDQQNEQHLMSLNNQNNPDIQHAILNQKSLLQIHSKLYERHRVKEIVELLKIMLLSNISYHAQALQAYSSLLESLIVIEDSVQDPEDYQQ